MNFLRWLLLKMAEEFLRISNLTLEIKFVQKNLQQIGKGFLWTEKDFVASKQKCLKSIFDKIKLTPRQYSLTYISVISQV